jgi:hypothetical protein
MPSQTSAAKTSSVMSASEIELVCTGAQTAGFLSQC